MNVLLLGDHPSQNWVGSSTIKIQQELSAALAASGNIEVTLYHPFRRREVLRYLLAPVSFVQRNGYREMSGGILPSLLAVLRTRYDVMHCVVTRVYMWCFFVTAGLASMHRIVTVHDTLFIGSTPRSMMHRVKSYVVRNAEQVLVLNPDDAERIREVRGRDGVTVVRNGHSLPSIGRSVNHNATVVFGGGIGNAHAGLEFLEESLHSCSSAPVLSICGTNARGAHHPAYRGALDRTAFHALIAAARMVVVPSRYESFSMTALESMALGIPVIVSAHCGIARYLTHGVDAVIVPYGDTDALRTAIDRLMSDDEFWQQLSAHGILTAGRFRWEAVIADHHAVYTMATNGGRG